MQNFKKSFTQQQPIPEAGIARVVELMRESALHRYTKGKDSETSRLEAEFAQWQGSQFCLACASGGYALALALRLLGVRVGDAVLSNAYTLAPVTGAIHNVGGMPILIESDAAYHLDLADFEAKAKASKAKVLLLSYMRGHIPDMDAVMAIADRHNLAVIEDCAHTMGASWMGVKSGNFGKIAAFSTQSYKHLNSGEGGLLTTNDAELAAKAVIASGSYMFYAQHGAIPDDANFEAVKYITPNGSGRMDEMRAAILRAQLPYLEGNVARWNALYRDLHQRLKAIKAITIPDRKQQESYVGSSIQFRLSGLDEAQIPAFVSRLESRGVMLKWFGADEPKGFTSRYDSWRYIKTLPHLPKTLAVLADTVDMRIPLTFNLDDTAQIAAIIADELRGN